MADVKFSELTSLSGTDLASDDIFAVVDTDATTSKKLTVDNLFASVPVNINQSDATDATSSAGAIRTAGGVSAAKKLYVGTTSTLTGAVTATAGVFPATQDGAALGSGTLQWADLFLADAGTITMGDDSDTTITHVADTGILLNSTRQMQFGDSGSYIAQPSNGVLRIDGEATVDINASTAVTISNDLKLDSDAAVLGLGADNDVTLTHYADNGLVLNSTRKIYFEDGSNYDQYIGSAGSGVTAINSVTELTITSPIVDIDASTAVEISNDLKLNSDAAVLGLGADNDVTLTHVADTGVLLNSTRQLQLGDAGTYIHQSADGALDLVSDGSINATVGAAGLVLKGTTPKLTLGDAGAEDTFLVFDGNAQDYRIGLDDGTDKIEFGIGATHGTTTAMTLGVNASVPVIQTTSAFAMAGTSGTFVTFGSSDTSPSVKDGNLFKTHASTQTLVDFDDGVIGQQICVISTAAVTYDASATELKCGSTDIVTASGDVTWWTYDGTYWYLFGFLDQSDDLSTGWSG